MSFLGTKSDAQKNINEVEPYNAPREASSPGLHGGSSPGPSNKLASETMTLRKKRGEDAMGSAANKGSGVTRKIE
jgi:hypothetical protein